MTQLCQISTQLQLPQNELKIAKFKNPDIDYQMSCTCGQYEPLYSPWNVFFTCVIAQYFISFLFEHTVEQCCNEDWKWTEDEYEDSSVSENRPKTNTKNLR